MNQLPLLAGYNRWANERVYQACSVLTDESYRQDRGAFFGSIHNTLNHLLVVDRIWLGRLLGQATPELVGLNQCLHDDFAALRTDRSAEDQRLIDVVESLDETALGELVTYRFVDGRSAATPRHLILITLFNHQTHHRGQVHTMLTQAGVDVPPLDIIVYANDKTSK